MYSTPSPMKESRPLSSGLCATCRHVEATLFRYTAQPWDIGYVCFIRASPLAPHALACNRYEREPGSDDGGHTDGHPTNIRRGE